MAHGGAFHSRTIRPWKNLQQKHSTISINNPGSPTVTRNIKPSRAACERSHAGEARFLWFFLFRKKKEQSPHAPARRASPPHGEHANKQAIRGASAPSITLSARRAPGTMKTQKAIIEKPPTHPVASIRLRLRFTGLSAKPAPPVPPPPAGESNRPARAHPSPPKRKTPAK